LAVINELRKIIQRQGHLMDAEVEGVVGRHLYDELRPDEAVIELFEKARKIIPRTSGQAAYVKTMREHELVFCVGPAGCGKTYLAVAMAVHALRQELIKKIVLVRPAVEAGEKLGFLPGDMLAKVNPFLRPLLDALHEMLDVEQVTRYMEKDVIEIVPLAFMRGRTLNNTFMILDEGQNTTVTQMKMFLTRMGIGSRIVVTGDTTQIDLPPHVASGLTDAIERLSKINGVAAARLTGRDIVRHRLVKEIVKAYEPIEHQTGTPAP
jgi:phosphate starvation-inducible PhoH-like protein